VVMEERSPRLRGWLDAAGHESGNATLRETLNPSLSSSP
jgi:hypothetical protein